MNKDEFISDEMLKVIVSINMIANLLDMHNGDMASEWIIRSQAADTLRVCIGYMHRLRSLLEEPED